MQTAVLRDGDSPSLLAAQRSFCPATRGPQLQSSIHHTPTYPSCHVIRGRPGPPPSPPRGHLLCSASVTKSFPDFLFPLNSSTSRGAPPSGAMGPPPFEIPKTDTFPYPLNQATWPRMDSATRWSGNKEGFRPRLLHGRGEDCQPAHVLP